MRLAVPRACRGRRRAEGCPAGNGGAGDVPTADAIAGVPFGRRHPGGTFLGRLLPGCRRPDQRHRPRAYRSCGLSRNESAQPHAPNGLERAGRRRTRPRSGDTDPVRGPVPGGPRGRRPLWMLPSRPGHMGTARGDGEAPNHHSGGAGAPTAGAVPGVPDRTATVARTAQATASPGVDHHTIELNRPHARSPASSWRPRTAERVPRTVTERGNSTP